MSTTSDRLRRAEELVLRLDELPEPERANALTESCRSDPELEREVRSLLDHAGRLAGFLETPAIGGGFGPTPAEVADEVVPDALIGRTLDRWQIESRIASGGMGTVYVARRADPEFPQRVALKVVKRGMDSEEVLRRFHQERLTLAGLDHPNIARLIDGGATPEGLPYLVMEYVEGERIDEFCDRRRLSCRERLRLFRTVCDAVRYAHQNLVVHRDLKPANMLVTPDGVPKLLDFGIAKVLEPSAPALATATLDRRLTPEYASPEQVAGAVVTTASDVFSLGVILYELLTGHRPHRSGTRTPTGVEPSVAPQDTIQPSDVVSRSETGPASTGRGRLTITPEAVARDRGVAPKQLRRILSGDLDVIVMRALHGDPGRRYGSVEHFADDIRRHLVGQPVLARRDSWGYRASKFVRRYRVATALSVISVLLLVGGVTAFAWQAAIASRQRDEAIAARDQSDAVTTFLQDMLAAARPEAGGPELTVRELLDAAADRLDTELASQPLVQASLRMTVGRTYATLGLYEDAERHFRQTLADRVDLLGEQHRDVAESKGDLAAVLFARGGFDEAERLLTDVLEVLRAAGSEAESDLAGALSSFGAVLRAQGQLDRSEHVQRRALEIRRQTSGDDSLDVAESLNNLAAVLAEQGRLPEALAASEEALEIRRARLGPRHPLVAQALDNLAVLHHRLGDLERAEPLYREALALEEEVLGVDHPDVAVTLSNLAALLRSRGDFSGAIDALRRVLAIRERVSTPSEMRVLSTQLRLADCLAAGGRWDEALSMVELAVEVAEGPETDPSARAVAISFAADLLERGGRVERATALRERLPKD